MDFINTVELQANEENFLHKMECDCKEKILLIERELANEPKKSESLRIWIACYHKLAEVYLLKEDIARAQEYLVFPHQSMLELANHQNSDADDVLIARKALHLTVPPLLAFSEKYPFCPKCVDQLKEQLAMLEKENAQYH